MKWTTLVPRRRRWAYVIAALLTGVFVAAACSTRGFSSFGGKLDGKRLERARRSPQFDGKEFKNPLPTHMLVPGTFWQMVRHQFFGDEQREPGPPLPVIERTRQDYAALPATGLRATWIGHATVLLEIDGARVLTDPIWSERASPSTLVGPRRFHAPPIALEALPPVNAVVISHDHYDHLDMDTIQALAARATHFAVPLGIGAHLEAWNVPAGQIHELDWGESTTLAGITLTATPARHYSGRNPLRANRTLWASWVIHGPQHRVFFSGDTGYFDGFAKIGERHGPFDLTLVKIGASDPTWKEIHMTPEEAVQTHLDVRGRMLLPVHWGTFNLGYHAWNQPAAAVTAAAVARGVNLLIPRPGEWVEPGAASPPLDRWWQ
jgi:L-ascorbate metabolism protein UlaG (beta-lactamase superfamily)